MAIVTISQIKHRRGVKGTDPMPQLASAEFGWAVDAQELYIGNGTITEGAPVTGNTEILTEHSDLSALLTDYTYSGPFSGAVMVTGPAPSSPITRTDIAHKDDRVSIKAFGAVGDGITDDTEAIQRAFDQHYKNQPANSRYWATIYFPSGTYKIDSRLEIPSHLRMEGDGFNSSIIVMDVAQSATILEMERVAGVDPTDIVIKMMGFQVLNTSSNVCTMAETTDVTFDLCAFRGASADTELVGNSKACVLFNNSAAPSSNIKFHRCLFTGATYGIATSDELGGPERRQDVTNVVVQSCVFDTLFKGIVLGFETGNTPSADPFPSEWRITGNYFDNITRHGIHGYKATRNTSSMNHFADVGNLQTGATPTFENIIWGDTSGDPNSTGNPILPGTGVSLSNYEDNYSIGDQFDRTDAVDTGTVKRIESLCSNSYIIDPEDIRFGSLSVEPGRLILLYNEILAATASGIALDSADYQGAIIDYQINRGADIRRTGTLRLTLGDTDQGLVDDYSETTVPTGVVLSLSTNAGVASIDYTATDIGSDISPVLSYSIRHLSCPIAIPVLSPPVILTMVNTDTTGTDSWDDGTALNTVATVSMTFGGGAISSWSWSIINENVTRLSPGTPTNTLTGATNAWTPGPSLTQNTEPVWMELQLTVSNASGSDTATIWVFTEVGA
jgi:hypothetical protein